MCFCTWSSAKHKSVSKGTEDRHAACKRPSSHEVVQLRLQGCCHLIRLRAAALLVLIAGLLAGLTGRILVIQLSLVASKEKREAKLK